MNLQVSSIEDCSCDVVNAGNTIELTLENFDSDEIPEDCPFVLTSPRSLEACKLVGVRVCKLQWTKSRGIAESRGISPCTLRN